MPGWRRVARGHTAETQPVTNGFLSGTHWIPGLRVSFSATTMPLQCLLLAPPAMTAIAPLLPFTLSKVLDQRHIETLE